MIHASAVRKQPLYKVWLGFGQAVLLLACLPPLARPDDRAQAGPEVRRLEPGAPVEQKLSAGETHAYRVTLAAGELMRASIDQRGVSVSGAVFGPDARLVARRDGAGQQVASLVIIAAAGGEYRLELRPAGDTEAAGRYRLILEEVRAATERDKELLAAEEAAWRSFAAAESLRLSADTASQRAAAAKYLEAIGHWRAAANQRRVANALNRLGLSYDNSSERARALDCYEQARALARSLQDACLEATALVGISRIYLKSGEDRQKLLGLLNAALTLARSVGERRLESGALTFLGTTYITMGQPQEGLKYLHQALAVSHSLGDREREAALLSALGVTYRIVNDKQLADEYTERARRLRQLAASRADATAGDSRRAAAVLAAQEATELYLQKTPQALRQAALKFREALELWRAAGDQPMQAFALFHLGAVNLSLGEKWAALDCFNRALGFWPAEGHLHLRGLTLGALGETHYLLGERDLAFEKMTQGLPLLRAVGDAQAEAWGKYTVGRIARDGRRLDEARAQFQTAVEISESQRARLLSPALRVSYFAQVADYYEAYIDVLMQLGSRAGAGANKAAAFEASERGRARGLLDLLAGARADIRGGVDPALLDRAEWVRKQLNAKATERALISDGSAAGLAAFNREVDSLLGAHREVEEAISAGSPRYAALTQPQPLTLGEIQGLLDADTLLLAYALGAERSYLWAVTPSALTGHELPGRSRIEAAARQLSASLSAPRGRQSGETPARHQRRAAKLDAASGAAAAELSRLLLAPVADQLGRKRLVIVGDGRLQRIPFAVLPDPTAPGAATRSRAAGREPLLVRHEIVNLPSASTLAALRRDAAGRSPAPKMVAALADPVFEAGDERVRRAESAAPPQATPPPAARPGGGQPSREAVTIQRLRGSREEAEYITRLAPAGSSKLALDFAASYATATSPELADYRYVHFATHGLLNDRRPELGGILLSLVDERGREQNGLLRVGEVYNLRLNAALVALSACETALGQEVRGEGLIGLVRGFMYAGAPRVVASLWKVEEDGTRELMQRFYAAMLGPERLRPAAALRQAQLALSRERRWRSPYYWGAFVLQGEWR